MSLEDAFGYHLCSLTPADISDDARLGDIEHWDAVYKSSKQTYDWCASRFAAWLVWLSCHQRLIV